MYSFTESLITNQIKKTKRINYHCRLEFSGDVHKTRQFFWQNNVFTLSIIWCFNMHIEIYHTLGNKNYTYLLTPQIFVMLLKHRISNRSSRRDI